MRTLFDPGVDLRPLRPRQTKVIADIRQAVREGHKRIVVQAPCGFGKTLTAAHLIFSSTEKGKRPIFTCPAITLVDQTLESFESEGLTDIGVIQAQHERTDWAARIQIASVQTLIRRELPECDFVIVDECHEVWDKFNVLLDSEAWKNKIVIGLSATPWTRGMGLRWTKLIIAATIQELIDEGFLCPFIVYAPADEMEADLSGVKVVKGEYDEGGLSAVMSAPELVADVVETWMKHRTAKTFLFAVDRAHARSLRDKFELAGVGFGYIDGTMSREDRQLVFKRFRSGEVAGIASVGCLTTGVDEDVRCVIDAAPTKSEKLYVQRIGRGVRTAFGKELLPIYDHAGNSLRLGLITDVYHDHLDTHKPGERGKAYEKDKPAPKPRKCPKCNTVIPPQKRECPKCGEKSVTFSRVSTRAGELVEYQGRQFDAGAIEFLESNGLRYLAEYGYENYLDVAKKHGYNPPQKLEKFAADVKQDFYSGLLCIALERKRNRGWVAHMYKDKFGVWPRGLMEVVSTPSPAVRKFEHSRRIAYAKSMEKEKANAPLQQVNG